MNARDKINHVSAALQPLASVVEEFFDNIVGPGQSVFILVIGTNIGDKGSVLQYVSNTDRVQGSELLIDLLERWKTGKADIPALYNPELKDLKNQGR